jgi:hypothetical protein
MPDRLLNSVWGLATQGREESDRLRDVIASHKGQVLRPLDILEKKQKLKSQEELDNKVPLTSVFKVPLTSAFDKTNVVRPVSNSLIPKDIFGETRPENVKNPFVDLMSVDSYSFESFYQQQRYRTGVGIDTVYKFLPDEIKESFALDQVKSHLSPAMRHVRCSAVLAASLWDVYVDIPSFSDPVRAEDITLDMDQRSVGLLAISRIQSTLANEQVHLGLKATGTKVARFKEDMISAGMPAGCVNTVVKAARHIQIIPRIHAILAVSMFVDGPEVTARKVALVQSFQAMPQTVARPAPTRPGVS